MSEAQITIAVSDDTEIRLSIDEARVAYEALRGLFMDPQFGVDAQLRARFAVPPDAVITRSGDDFVEYVLA